MLKPVAGMAAVLLLLSVGSIGAAAAEQERAAAGEEEHARHDMLELFLGNTSEDTPEGRENAVSFGLAYERRVSRMLGVGVFCEDAAGNIDKWSIGAPLLVHPYRGWRFTVAPGVEYHGEEDAFRFRTGLAYEVELAERWALIPEVSVDFVDDQQSYVLGLSLGFGL